MFNIRYLNWFYQQSIPPETICSLSANADRVNKLLSCKAAYPAHCNSSESLGFADKSKTCKVPLSSPITNLSLCRKIPSQTPLSVFI